MPDCLLDASVPLTLIFGEPHTIDPDELLASAGMSPVNLTEFAAIMRMKGIPDEEISATIRDFGLVSVPFDEKAALAAAELIPLGRPLGIGLGDCACIATRACKWAADLHRRPRLAQTRRRCGYQAGPLMTGELIPSAQLPDTLQREIKGAHDTLRAARSPATRKAYASDWNRFCSFCEERDVEALPAAPEMVALFAHMEAEAGIAPVTIGRRVAAINYHHRQEGVPSPAQRDTGGMIAEMMAGVRRKYARAKDQKAPAQADILKAMLDAIEGMSQRGAT